MIQVKDNKYELQPVFLGLYLIFSLGNFSPLLNWLLKSWIKNVGLGLLWPIGLGLLTMKKIGHLDSTLNWKKKKGQTSERLTNSTEYLPYLVGQSPFFCVPGLRFNKVRSKNWVLTDPSSGWSGFNNFERYRRQQLFLLGNLMPNYVYII